MLRVLWPDRPSSATPQSGAPRSAAIAPSSRVASLGARAPPSLSLLSLRAPPRRPPIPSARPLPSPRGLRRKALCVTAITRPARLSFAVQRDLTCHACGNALLLLQTGAPNYRWGCPQNCLPALDTGVPSSEPLDELRRDESGTVEFNGSHFFPPLTKSRVATAKVFMPKIRYHFIECTWGACYNSLYSNVLVPHLDSVAVLDYVLRSPVVRGEVILKDGNPAPKIFHELFGRLRGVQSPRIQQYLADTFQTPHQQAR